MNTVSIQRVSLWGNKREHAENSRVALLMLLVTIVYECISRAVLPDFTFNIYEFIGTWAGLVTVWLCRTENILCWPWGVVSAATLGYFFLGIGLPGQQWLNWGYFLIIQFWAWPHWAFGGEDKTVLPVTTLTTGGRMLTLLSIVLGSGLVYLAIDLLVPGSQYPLLDAVVVASSVVAQYLLGRKNVESWILWLGPVNLLSIILFYNAGAYTVMALYIAFLIHAFFALKSWYMSVERA
jgi:nicotinamide mononucleotide transporter